MKKQFLLSLLMLVAVNAPAFGMFRGMSGAFRVKLQQAGKQLYMFVDRHATKGQLTILALGLGKTTWDMQERFKIERKNELKLKNFQDLDAQTMFLKQFLQNLEEKIGGVEKLLEGCNDAESVRRIESEIAAKALWEDYGFLGKNCHNLSSENQKIFKDFDREGSPLAKRFSAIKTKLKQKKSEISVKEKSSSYSAWQKFCNSVSSWFRS